jgi:hypothetical protein
LLTPSDFSRLCAHVLTASVAIRAGRATMAIILLPLGEKQVNFSDLSGDGLVGTQGDPAVAALSNGNFVVVYENPFDGTTDLDLLAHFFDANERRHKRSHLQYYVGHQLSIHRRESGRQSQHPRPR